MNGPEAAAHLGLTRQQWENSQPTLTRENERVVAVWNFCGGWNPQALPLAFLYYEIADADFMISQLLLLRKKMDDHTAAQEASRGQ